MDPAMMQAPTRYVSLRVKIWIGFILIFTPVFVASYYWFYQYTSQRVLQGISDSLVDTIDGAIRVMDVDGFVKLYKEESTTNPACSPAAGNAKGYYPEDNPLYMEHVNWLYTVQQIAPNTRIYTYVRGPGAGDIVAIGSTGYFRTPRGGFKFCELYNSQGKTQIAEGLIHRVDRWNIYTDSFGSWITTYQPITDANGHTVGAIGVDISADYVKQVRQGILISGAVAFVLSYLLIFLLVYWFSGLMTRPIIALAQIATDIGDGQYEQDWSKISTVGSFRDEIGTLTRVFHSMVDRVAEREKSLRARVAQLEIMIDHSKLETQVQEIVESDFFQDLRSKVKDMRTRFKDTDKGQEK